MKIKLIAPRATMRPMDSYWKTQMSPPLSLAVLAALTDEAHEVTIEDENIERGRLDDTPDLVGLTVKVDTFARAREIAAAYRLRGIPVVMGGIHATACPEQCRDHADAVVIGEAETLWAQVVDDAAHCRLQPCYRNEVPVDIAAVPVPRWECLSDKDYLFTNTIRISRGCPWRCEFCYNSCDNVRSGFRMKPIQNILREIASLGTRHVMFIDDNFIGSIPGARRLMHAFRSMNLTWHAAVSADIGRHDDLLDLMAETGCKSLFIGFESIRGDSLACCGKVQNRIDEYDALIRKIHERGMLVNASVVFGFDHDDPAVFASTLEWLERNRVSTMTAHILTPYPGTRLYRRLSEAERIMDHDLTHYNTSHAVFRPAGMSAAELEAGYAWMYKRFYSWSSIWRRLPLHPSQITAYLLFAIVYRKYGALTSRLGRLVGMRRLAKLARAMAYPTWRRFGQGERSLAGELGRRFGQGERSLAGELGIPSSKACGPLALTFAGVRVTFAGVRGAFAWVRRLVEHSIGGHQGAVSKVL